MLTKNQIKIIRSLAFKKNRKLLGLFVVEGEKLVQELLESNWHIETIYATNDWNGQGAITISKKELQKISFLKTPNKVLALVKIKENYSNYDGNTILALDDINDPGNLGTIIRLADWFGVNSILCSENTVDCFNPKVIQSSMGSIFRVPISYINLQKTLSKLNDFDIYLTELNADKSYKDIRLSNKRIIVFGNESKGINSTFHVLNHKKVFIPKDKGSNAEALNVAVSCSICLSSLK